MVPSRDYVTFVAMTSCLALLGSADTRNADAASTIADDALPHWTTQQQQQQQYLQRLQQQPRSRYSHLATELQALLPDKIDYPSNPVNKPNKPLDRFVELTSSVDPISGINYAGQSDSLRIKKRETDAFLHGNDQQTESGLFVGEFPPSAFSLTPYLSAEEYKEKFRRSNPYILGKRTSYMLPTDDVSISRDTRGAPMFIGRRGSSNVSDKTDSVMGLENYLSQIDYVNDIDSIEGENSRGKSDNGKMWYLESKRRAPKFVGKRVTATDFVHQNGLMLGNKRGAPKFVGRRGAPLFVGKRGPPMFVGKRLMQFDYPALSVLEGKRGSPKFVGKRGFSFFSGKRGAPIFVGKRVDDFDDELLLSGDRRAAPKFVGRRDAPFFVGRRQSSAFVGKYDQFKSSGKHNTNAYSSSKMIGTKVNEDESKLATETRAQAIDSLMKGN